MTSPHSLYPGTSLSRFTGLPYCQTKLSASPVASPEGVSLARRRLACIELVLFETANVITGTCAETLPDIACRSEATLKVSESSPPTARLFARSAKGRLAIWLPGPLSELRGSAPSRGGRSPAETSTEQHWTTGDVENDRSLDDDIPKAA